MKEANLKLNIFLQLQMALKELHVYTLKVEYDIGQRGLKIICIQEFLSSEIYFGCNNEVDFPCQLVLILIYFYCHSPIQPKLSWE